MIGVDCPLCNALNVIYDKPTEVKCKSCGSTFKVRKKENSDGTEHLYNIHPPFSFLLRNDKLPVSKTEKRVKSTEYSWRGTY